MSILFPNSAFSGFIDYSLCVTQNANPSFNCTFLISPTNQLTCQGITKNNIYNTHQTEFLVRLFSFLNQKHHN